MNMILASKLVMLTMAMVFAGSVAAQEPITPIEPIKEINLAMVELGKKLFFDPRLSKSGFISCNSCHNLSMGGTDNLKTSIGHNWQQGPINSPTVLNSSMNVAQFWDGRAADLKEQAGGPIANPGEMAFTHTLAVDVLESIPAYVTEFTQGLAGVTGKDADRFKFKVPTLRNVELTYPYFHDGEAATLTEAVDIMGRLQLARKFETTELEKIVAFLKTLTGDQPSFALPILPPSTDLTPRPVPFE